MKPLLIAATACLAVTAPWFARNAVVFGDPFFTINHFSLHFDCGAKYALDLDGARPMIRIELLPAATILSAMLRGTPAATAWWIACMSLVVPALGLFAPGGFARMVARRPDGTRSAEGCLVFASFVALVAATVLWPGIKGRYFVPLTALATGAACVELAAGARFVPAMLTALVSIACGWAIDAPNHPSFPWAEVRVLLPTAALALLALGDRGRRALPAVCLAILVAHGAFRVALSLDRSLTSWMFDVPSDEAAWRLGPPTATFYDVLFAPQREGIELLDDRDRDGATAALRDAGVRRVVGPPPLASSWTGTFVASAFRRGGVFNFDPLAAAIRAFRADGVVFDSDADRSWLAPFAPVLLYEGPRLAAFRVTAP